MSLEECSTWLYKKLKSGKKFSCNKIKKEAREKGFTKTDLRVARIGLEVKTYHQFPTAETKEDCLWYLEV